jgi:hypothetical protein
MEFTPKSKLTHTPIEKPCRTQVVLPESDLNKLKINAFLHKTTVSEIIRVLVSEYLKSLDEESKER